MGLVARLRLSQAVASLCAASLCICCGAAAEAPQMPSAPLSPYAGRAVELFDDVIEPGAVGYEGADPGLPPQGNALLRERTQVGDAVVRARVVTVTSDPETAGAGWRIGLHVLETVAGKRPPADDFTFVVGGASPAAGIVRTLDARLVGATFLVFVRQFGRTAGPPPQATTDPVTGVPAAPVPAADGSSDSAAGSELHFHFARDDKDELGAVREANLLGEFK
jgi:hypothetical protein